MNYPSIRVEGAILSPELIDRLEDAPGQRPADFALETGSKVKDEIARAWADAQDYWRIFQRKLASLKPDSPATSETRNLWLVPLLGLLRYDLEFQKAGAELNGKIYAISHRVTHRAQTPVHIVGCNDPAGLDRKPANASLRMSAHALVQEYLNLHEQLYGIVTNGRVLRLLRDSSRLIKQSYLEFDLDRIFTDGLFADFAVLYRLLHASRLPISNETATESLLERYHQDSLDSGARIREGLSKAVEYAILGLGNGFLSHPKNSLLRDRLAGGDLAPADYYKSLLRLIYRLLFLMVIEERDLVFPEQTPRHQRDTYFRFYSLQRLRSLSEKRHLADKRQHDLWLALHKHFSDRARRDPEGLRIPEEHRAAALVYSFETALHDLEQLRRLHVELDLAVRDAYGWQDLDLGHAFHEVETLPENDRTRYTLSPEARKELLRRLLQENHARAAEEAVATTLPAAAKAARKPRTTKTAKVTVSPGELDLF